MLELKPVLESTNTGHKANTLVIFYASWAFKPVYASSIRLWRSEKMFTWVKLGLHSQHTNMNTHSRFDCWVKMARTHAQGTLLPCLWLRAFIYVKPPPMLQIFAYNFSSVGLQVAYYYFAFTVSTRNDRNRESDAAAIRNVTVALAIASHLQN